jgi:hypothetical protein
VVLNNGSDGATSQMWLAGGAAASARGYHWMTFDGPGQQAALFEQGISFRPDWEAVLTPVLDTMSARPDVDPARMAVIRVSQAGYWVPRALAFEHRPPAAVVDPGVTDVSASWTRHLPAVMRDQLRDGEEQQITTPLLITDPEDEQFWPGQSEDLYRRLPGNKELIPFTAREGASRHCEPMARSLRETRIFDWLGTYLR